jgi:3-oxoacyl-[acyl-carrier protein] reductase
MAEQHKLAPVTGSALSIGRATALALARRLSRHGDGTQLRRRCARTAEMIVEAGGEAAVHLADISDAKQARGLVEAAVTRFG